MKRNNVKQITIRLTADEYAEIRRQLAAIGNNINQIARTVNARGFASGEDIAAITAAQETIWNIAERL